MTYEIPQAVFAVLQCLRNNGFRAVVVGGCVRDLLRGSVPHDWDVATSATPEEMRCLFAQQQLFKVILTGEKHGTVTVLSENSAVEATTFRTDGEYSDGRRPDSVRFSRRLEDDLARRDFTINAMCIGESGELIDIFGGRQDLNNGIIRAIGNADRRFCEDALRMLRALRFAAALDFIIAPQTAESLLRHTNRLATLSAERVASELTKLICAPASTRVMLAFREIILAVIPELTGAAQTLPADSAGHTDFFSRNVHALAFAPQDAQLRYALLLKDIAQPCNGNLPMQDEKPDMSNAVAAKQLLTRLKFSKALRNGIYFLVLHQHLPLYSADRFAVKQWLLKYGDTVLHHLITLQLAVAQTLPPPMAAERSTQLRQTQALLQNILNKNPVFKLSQLAVNGRDLAEIGVPDGPQMREILLWLLNSAALEALPNNKSDLLLAARSAFLERKKTAPN